MIHSINVLSSAIAMLRCLFHGFLVDCHVPLGWLLGRKVTPWRKRPFSRFTDMNVTSEPSRSASRRSVGITLPSCVRHSVMPGEQRSHNQKYSVALASDDPTVWPVSNRKSCPSAIRRNKAEHKGFVHLASIATLLTNA
jgi:hypothetical protein